MGSRVLSATYLVAPVGWQAHDHDHHQILYITKGESSITVAGRDYALSAGSLVIISRFEQHAITVHSPTYHRYSVRIDPTPLPEETEEQTALYSLLVDRPPTFSHVIRPTGEAGRIKEILAALCEEKQRGTACSDSMLNLLFTELLIRLRRSCPVPPVTEEGTRSMVEQIKREFETNYRSAHTLEMLSQQHHISPYYLSHIFKEVTGSAVMQYLLGVRIAQAKRRLAQTELPIGTVMEECGFSDSSNFSRIFKQHTGVSPREFRLRNRHAGV